MDRPLRCRRRSRRGKTLGNPLKDTYGKMRRVSKNMKFPFRSVFFFPPVSPATVPSERLQLQWCSPPFCSEIENNTLYYTYFVSVRAVDRSVFAIRQKKKKWRKICRQVRKKLRTRLGKFVRINVYYTSSYWSFIPLLHKSNSHEISHSVSKDETANYWSIFIVRFLKFRKLYFF